MDKTNIFDERYRYLSYPINDEDKLFIDGMPIKSPKINNTYKNVIAYNEQGFQTWLQLQINAPASSKKNCILKIPSYYFGYRKSEKEYTPCLPFVKTIFNYEKGEASYVIPELVLGVYDDFTKEYKANPNYNPFFDPNGLQFIDEQIYTMKNHYSQIIADYALYRRYTLYKTLYDQDQKNQVFLESIAYYDRLTKENSDVNDQSKKSSFQRSKKYR